MPAFLNRQMMAAPGKLLTAACLITVSIRWYSVKPVYLQGHLQMFFILPITVKTGRLSSTDYLFTRLFTVWQPAGQRFMPVNLRMAFTFREMMGFPGSQWITGCGM